MPRQTTPGDQVDEQEADIDKAIVVSLQDDALASAGAVVARLRSAGMKVDQVLSEVGTVTGSIVRSKISDLANVPGVDSVEEGRTIDIGPPDSDIP